MRYIIILILPVLLAINGVHSHHKNSTGIKVKAANVNRGCVFRTFFAEDPYTPVCILKASDTLAQSVEKALIWISKAQNTDGGWGAGLHSAQHIMDPHAVKSDPATTAMVAMALLRSGSTPSAGSYSINLSNATSYLLRQVESSSENELNITTLNGTQIQTKLGLNIDVILTCQYLTNLLEYIKANPVLTSHVKKAVNKCVMKIQNGQNPNGSQQGAGWAGVLQSSFAATALESAEHTGISVDKQKLNQARNYQKLNFDSNSKTAKTDDAAGVLLYAISGSARSSAKEAREAEETIAKAKKQGMLAPDEKVTVSNLRKAGLSENEAMRFSTAYHINQSAMMAARQQDVMSGFGSNGGEEFLSFLQTGESLIVSANNEWQKWYNDMTTRLMQIQNADGSWNGHHCITSPVFCTATCLLIFNIVNDADRLRGSN